jgi:uncharacterized protein (TIGR00255 family)
MSIQSMTGFAERSFSGPTLRVKVGIKSLNHRFFDWSYKGAPLGEVENRLRVLCQARISRGRIEAAMDVDSIDPASWEVKINEALLEKILGSFTRASARLGREIAFSLENLFRIPQLTELKRKAFSSEEKAFLETCFLRTLEPLIRARAAEGRKTAAQIKVHLGNVRSAMARVEKLAARQPKAVQTRLRKKMKDVNGSSPASQNRLDEEVAYLTQRYDVAEEIQRLRSHLGGARDLLVRPGADPAGKMLDFIAQELTREANTLNSKSQDIDMTRQGLLIKNEVESIRQQVQNLE